MPALSHIIFHPNERRNNNLVRETTHPIAPKATHHDRVPHLLGDILLRRRHMFLVQIRQKPRNRQQRSLYQRGSRCSLCFRSSARCPFGSCPHLADATAEIISEKPAYNNSVRKGQGQSMAALKLKRLLRKAQVFWRISKK